MPQTTAEMLNANLQALAEAIAAGEAPGIEAAALALQQTLKAGPKAMNSADLPALEHLLAQTTVLREAVTRAQVQTQQGLAALLPQVLAGALYGASGQPQGLRSTGLAEA